MPAVAAGAASQLESVRSAAVSAVAWLLAQEPDLLVVCGEAPGAGVASVETLVRADFRTFGSALVLGNEAAVRLPPALAVGRWLLEAAGWVGRGERLAADGAAAGGAATRPAGSAAAAAYPTAARPTGAAGTTGTIAAIGAAVGAATATTAAAASAGLRTRWLGVGRDVTGEQAARAGREIAGLAPRVALLAMGDGSACLSAAAPGAFDPRAEDFDGRVATALAAADAGVFAALDDALAAQLRVAGLGAWRVLAAAAEAAGGPWHGDLTAHESPFGVGYFVATWRPA